jgi:hypothetical protein
VNDEIRIEMTGAGKGKVWVNGEEVKGVRRIEFTAGVGEINTVTIKLAAHRVTVTAPIKSPPQIDITNLDSQSKDRFCESVHRYQIDRDRNG